MDNIFQNLSFQLLGNFEDNHSPVSRSPFVNLSNFKCKYDEASGKYVVHNKLDIVPIDQAPVDPDRALSGEDENHSVTPQCSTKKKPSILTPDPARNRCMICYLNCDGANIGCVEDTLETFQSFCAILLSPKWRTYDMNNVPLCEKKLPLKTAPSLCINCHAASEYLVTAFQKMKRLEMQISELRAKISNTIKFSADLYKTTDNGSVYLEVANLLRDIISNGKAEDDLLYDFRKSMTSKFAPEELDNIEEPLPKLDGPYFTDNVSKFQCRAIVGQQNVKTEFEHDLGILGVKNESSYDEKICCKSDTNCSSNAKTGKEMQTLINYADIANYISQPRCNLRHDVCNDTGEKFTVNCELVKKAKPSISIRLKRRGKKYELCSDVEDKTEVTSDKHVDEGSVSHHIKIVDIATLSSKSESNVFDADFPNDSFKDNDNEKSEVPSTMNHIEKVPVKNSKLTKEGMRQRNNAMCQVRSLLQKRSRKKIKDALQKRRNPTAESIEYQVTTILQTSKISKKPPKPNARQRFPARKSPTQASSLSGMTPLELKTHLKMAAIQKRAQALKAAGITDKAISKLENVCDMPHVRITDDGQCFYKNIEIKTVGEGLYTCGECEHGPKNKAYYGIYIHINEKHVGATSHEYKCEPCEISFYYLYNYRQHVRQKHNKDKFQCQFCGQLFTTLDSRSNHIRVVHKGIKPHTCEYCGKPFGTKKHMTIRIGRHTGETTFVCHCCAQTFIEIEAQTVQQKIENQLQPEVKNEQALLGDNPTPQASKIKEAKAKSKRLG